MHPEDATQDQLQPDASAQGADTPAEAPSLTDELSAARNEEQTPENPSDEPETQTDTPQEETDTDSTETPANDTDTTQQDQPADTTETDDQPAKPDLKSMTREERAEFFRNLQAEQSAKDKAEVARKIDEHYQPQQQDDLKQKYLDAGYEDFQAELLARDERREQAAQIAEERTRVVELNARINQEALQVMHDFPVFDPDSPEYDKNFAEKAAAMYQQSAATKVDELSGVVLSTNMAPYAFYKNLFELRDAGLSQAQMKAQKAAERQMASVSPPSSAPPPASPKNEDDAQAQGLENAFRNV